MLDIGGTTNLTFALDAKGHGHGVNGFGSCNLRYNKNTSLWSLKVKLAKGSWQGVWAGQGLANTTTPNGGTSVQLMTVVVINDQAFAANQSLNYIAKAGSRGIAR